MLPGRPESFLELLAAMPSPAKPKKPATRRVAVALIRQDGGTQARVAVDQLVVDDYANAYRSGAAFPRWLSTTTATPFGWRTVSTACSRPSTPA